MTHEDYSFDEWFNTLTAEVLARSGFRFCDPDAVREDYDAGMNMHDVADDIVAEYEEAP